MGFPWKAVTLIVLVFILLLYVPSPIQKMYPKRIILDSPNLISVGPSRSMSSYTPTVEATNLTIHWLIANSCSDLQIESLHLIYSMRMFGAKITVQKDATYCDENPEYIETMLEQMESERLSEGETYDVLICNTCFHGNFDTNQEKIPKFKFFIIRTQWDSTGVPDQNKYLLQRAEEVWVPSQYNLEIYSERMLKERLYKIPETMDLDTFSPFIASHLDRSRISPVITSMDLASYNFLFFSRWGTRKNWDMLIDVFIEKFHNNNQVALFIVADENGGLPKKKIMEYIYKNPTSNKPKIEIISAPEQQPFTPADIIYLYSQVNCFVYPSQGESWGLSIMEAMSMELPVIVTAFGGSTEFAASPASNKENSSFFGGWGIRHYKIEPAYPGKRWKTIGVWPVPDRVHLGSIMKYASMHVEESKKRGKAGRQHLLKHFSHEVLGQIGLEHLDRVSQKIANGEYSSDSVLELKPKDIQKKKKDRKRKQKPIENSTAVTSSTS